MPYGTVNQPLRADLVSSLLSLPGRKRGPLDKGRRSLSALCRGSSRSLLARGGPGPLSASLLPRPQAHALRLHLRLAPQIDTSISSFWIPYNVLIHDIAFSSYAYFTLYDRL